MCLPRVAPSSVLCSNQQNRPSSASSRSRNVEVAFLILGGGAALGVDRGIGQRPAPGGGERALLTPAAENFVDDLDHGLVLEDVAVAVVAEEGEPGFDGQPVAGEAAVGAEPFDAGDVAVEGAKLGARLAGEQVEPGRLADLATING